MLPATTIYRALLRGYPAPFRHEYGDQMSLLFAEQLREARRSRVWHKEPAVWLQAAWDLVTVAPREHWHVIEQDLRHAFRTMATKPAFPLVAILSLALGIGANTALFGLWYGVLRASLPGVVDADRLVMLTDPQGSGLWRGAWGGRDGPRPWVTYEEFEELRDQASAFSTLMASQNSLTSWGIRIDGATAEQTSGRLVSDGYFDVLGVRPALGRVFTARGEAADPAVAVISYSYWQQRFGRSADVLGKTLVIGGVPITVVGVAASGFSGETSGQQPDLWLPLQLQPRLFGGNDWLHVQRPEKVMWLHVFGRLRAGVAAPQAEAQANAIFRGGLESFYNGTTDERRRDLLDQRLRLYPAPRGASATADQYSSSMTMLLAAVGILLLIACANLANLLLARGAARRGEIAVRMSMGASRSRLVRQLVTESLALAVLGGLAAIVVAIGFHAVFLRMLQQAEPDLVMNFALGLPVLAFTIAVTIVAALIFGGLPAWQMTNADAGAHLASESRGTIASMRESRSGRWLVALQMALSLPLLAGAGLMARTLYNLQHPELGFRAERMLLARVNLNELVRDVPRRDRVLRDLRARLQQIPSTVCDGTPCRGSSSLPSSGRRKEPRARS